MLFVLFFASCKEATNKNTTPTSEPEIVVENGESFNVVDVATIAQLNQKIVDQNLKTGEEIMRAYNSEKSADEGNYTYTVTEKNVDEKTLEVTLIEDGILDDSVAGQKVVMTLKKTNGTFKVVLIKKNYKCWQGRGHQNWSAELCR